MPRIRRSSKVPSVRFNLECYDNKDKTCLIYAFFRYKGKRLKYSVGEKIKSSHWDKRSQRAKQIANSHYIELNKRLNKIQSDILAVYHENNLGNIEIEEFKRLLDIRQGLIEDKNRTPTFFEFVPTYIKERKEAPNARKGTVKNFGGHFQHLVDFADQFGKFDYDDVDWNLRNNLVNFLLEKDLNPNTINKIFQSFKMFLNSAKRKGYHTNSVYQEPGFNIRKVPTNKLVFYKEDTEKLFNLDLSNDSRLEKVRDVFLIGCFTIQRFSDYINIKPEQIKSFEGYKLIDIYQQKTGALVSLPLLPELEFLLEKYHYKVPKISIQKFNEYLKEVAKLAGFTNEIELVDYEKGKQIKRLSPFYQEVSSHMARRSGATIFYLEGWPVSNLMKLTGHTTEAQFFNYVQVGNRLASKHMIDTYKKILSKSNLKAI